MTEDHEKEIRAHFDGLITISIFILSYLMVHTKLIVEFILLHLNLSAEPA